MRRREVDRQRALQVICSRIFRQIVQKCLSIHEKSAQFFGQNDKKYDSVYARDALAAPIRI